MDFSPVDTPLLASTRTTSGQTLAALSAQSPVLLILLRHEGCAFCRNAMSDVARLRRQIEKTGARIVLGHMGAEADFATFAGRYGLADLDSVSDTSLELYRGLGLRRGTLLQLMGLRVLWAGLKAALSGHLPGRVKGDPLQLPGAFLLRDGRVVRAHLYRDVSDRPDYVGLATI